MMPCVPSTEAPPAAIAAVEGFNPNPLPAAAGFIAGPCASSSSPL